MNVLAWVLSFVVGAAVATLSVYGLAVGVESGHLSRTLAYGLFPLVGVLEGLIQGAAQALIFRRAGFLISSRRWVLVTVACGAALWTIAALGAQLEPESDDDLPAALLVVGSIWVMASMGAARGAAQWLVLRPTVRFAGAWVIANAGALVCSGVIGLALSGGEADILAGTLQGSMWLDGLAGGVAMGLCCAAGMSYLRAAGSTRPGDADQHALIVGQGADAERLEALMREAGVTVVLAPHPANVADARALAEQASTWPGLNHLVLMSEGADANAARGVLGPFVLVRALTDALAVARGRVVLTAGGRHRVAPPGLNLADELGYAKARWDLYRMQLLSRWTGPLRARGVAVLAADPPAGAVAEVLLELALDPRAVGGAWYVGLVRKNPGRRVFARDEQTALVNALEALEAGDE